MNLYYPTKIAELEKKITLFFVHGQRKFVGGGLVCFRKFMEQILRDSSET